MILLTHGYFLEEDPKEREIMKPYVPLGILYISAYLHEQGLENRVLDSTFSTFDQWKHQVIQMRPRIVGIYTNLMTKLNVLKMVNHLKVHLPETKIVLGGPEVRHHAENFLRHGADVIVIGEGEETMAEICRTSLMTPELLASINGIAFLDRNGGMFMAGERKNIRDMDRLPVPARHQINLQRYFDAWKSRHGYSSLSVSTMRGCPYTCKWCSRAVYGQTYRRRSAQLVADEIAALQKDYSFDNLWFVDDVFTISHKWLEEFLKALQQRKLSIRYECITRADRMNEHVIRLLKDSGCFRVWIGAESGSQNVIDLMDRRVDVGQVREMIRLARQHGIEAGTFIMLGYPGETEEDIEQTIRHLVDSDPDQFTITVAYPIKGTRLYEEVEERFTTQLPWESSTDRELDFRRAYSRKFYDYAVRRVNNEVRYRKTRRPVFRLKSLVAKAGMLKERLFNS